MNDTPRVDADELLKIGKLCSDWFNGLDIAGQKPVELFDVLYLKTTEYLRGGVSIDKARFTSAELNAAMKSQDERDDSPEVASRYVRENLKKYQTLLEERGDELDALLHDSGVHQRIVISKTESKGRNKSYYYLDLEPIASEDCQPEVKLPLGAVRYRVSQMPTSGFFNRTVFGYAPEEWQQAGFLVASFIMGILVFIVFINLIDASNAVKSLGDVLGLILATWFVWYFWEPIYLLFMQKAKIIQAPIWWGTDFNHPLAEHELLEVIRSDKVDANSEPINAYRLVVYDAKCSVCDGHVRIERAGREFNRRLIGVCENAPIEHLFSFDHITKIGVPLRQNGYYGNTT